MAVAILRDEQLAEEAVHEASVRALRHRAGFDQRGSLEAWLWRIVVNEARRRRSIERAAPLSPLTLDDAAALASANGHRDSGAVEALVATLPERQRLRPLLLLRDRLVGSYVPPPVDYSVRRMTDSVDDDAFTSHAGTFAVGDRLLLKSGGWRVTAVERDERNDRHRLVCEPFDDEE